MRLGALPILLVSLAVAGPVAAGAAHGGDDFTAVLEAKEKQKAANLQARVVCPDQPCEATLEGRARAGGERFELRPKARSLAAGDRERFRLRARHLDELEDLLADQNGVATVKMRAVDPAGVVAKAKVKVTLTG